MGLSNTDKRKQGNKDNRLMKIFNRHKEKHYNKFNKIAQCFKWNDCPDINGLLLVNKFIARTGTPLMTKVDDNGVFLDVLPEELERFLDKTDETVNDVVQALLQSGVSYRSGKLFIQIT